MRAFQTVAECNEALVRTRDTGVNLTPEELTQIEATVRSYAVGPYKQELLTLIDNLEAREAVS